MTGGDTTPFGERLRLHREAAGLTQEALAERAGLTAKGIAAIERGRRRRPYPHTVRALADALELDEEARGLLLGNPVPTEAAPPVAIRPVVVAEPPTPLIGRERELAEARAILLSGGARLLTLTGPGGVGKTRLSLALAAAVAPAFPDGVALAPLAALTDPDLVLPTIARALGLAEVAGRALREVVHTALRDRRLLLVIDNWEQVIVAAPEVAALLAACPGVTVLATSRAPLRLRGEREYPLAPLAIPELAHFPVVAQVADNPAVQLFVDRAHSVAPGFALGRENVAAVAAICRRLDGLPLALELAAARARLLSPTELLARLDRALPLLAGGARDLPDRQRTMERAIGWSYDLVAPDEARLFRVLATFTGGWDYAAAEAIDPEGDVLLLLGALVEQALVLVTLGDGEEPRYRMLEPVRQYAAQRLAESGEEEAARRRHADYFLALAADADAGLRSAEQAAWLDRLEREHDNLRAALTWAATSGAVEAGLRATGALSRFWWTRGHINEGRRWVDRLLALPDATPTVNRAEALNGAGNLAFLQGDYAAAQRFHESSLALRRELGDQRGIAGSLNNLGLLVTQAGDLAGGRALYTEAIAINRATGNRTWEATSLGNLADTLARGGDHAAARDLLEQGLALFESLGNEWGIAMILAGLGDVHRALGEPETSRDYFTQSLARRRAIGDRRGITQALLGLGHLAVDARDFGVAHGYFGEALAIARELADRQRLVACLEGSATLAAAEGQAREALLLDGAAIAQRIAIGTPRPPFVSSEIDRALAPARAALDAGDAEAARATGATLPLEEILDNLRDNLAEEGE
ncbi:MAG TPA: tetratricopeptide repeat protein [Thermomicrobiales bacterium]